MYRPSMIPAAPVTQQTLMPQKVMPYLKKTTSKSILGLSYTAWLLIIVGIICLVGVIIFMKYRVKSTGAGGDKPVKPLPPSPPIPDPCEIKEHRLCKISDDCAGDRVCTDTKCAGNSNCGSDYNHYADDCAIDERTTNGKCSDDRDCTGKRTCIHGKCTGDSDCSDKCAVQEKVHGFYPFIWTECDTDAECKGDRNCVKFDAFGMKTGRCQGKSNCK